MAYEELHWTPEMIQRFWDFEGQKSGRYFSEMHAHAISALLLQHCPPPCEMLDYGCGPGHLMQVLADTGYAVTGYEVSPDSVTEVNKRLGGHKGFRGLLDDATASETKDKFDLATVIEVVEHLYDPALDELLANVRDKLRPGGTILITTPHEEDLAASQLLCPVSGQVFHRFQHVRRWTIADLSDALSQRGFEISRCEAVDFSSMVGAALNRRSWPALRKAVSKQFRYIRKPNKSKPHLVALARKS